MVKTPIFGPFSQSSSLNLSDFQCMNLIPRVEETKQGMEIGALFLAPGLDLFTSVGSGPIWGEYTFTGLLFVVSGSEVFQVAPDGSFLDMGPITGVTGPVSMTDNGNQLGIFTTTGGWLIGPNGTPGAPLISGSIATAGLNYNVGDLVTMTPVGGSGQQATLVVEITSTNPVDGSVSGWGVASINGIFNTGWFPGPPTALPTSFTQNSTTGSGSGFTIGTPSYGADTYLYQIPLPFTPAGQVECAQLDGFVVINQPTTYLFFQSELLDMSIWPPLAFGAASGSPDVIQTIKEIGRKLYMIKTYETEVWVNAGTSPLVFQRLDGVYIEKGTLAIASASQVGEELMWFSRDRDGICQVVRLQGLYNTKIVSDSSVTSIWQSYSTTNDAVAYSYQQGGKRYYVISFPSGNSTWVYDTSDSDLLGVPCWHQRGAYEGGVFNRHWAQLNQLSGGKGRLFGDRAILGDYRNGNLYTFNPNTLTDNGTPRKWLRTWRARNTSDYSMDPTRFNSLQIIMQVGVNVPPSTTPAVTIRWSDDGANTWSDYRVVEVGALGETAQRVKTNRLGSTKRNQGLDRIFELSNNGTDVFPVAIIDADLT